MYTRREFDYVDVSVYEYERREGGDSDHTHNSDIRR